MCGEKCEEKPEAEEEKPEEDKTEEENHEEEKHASDVVDEASNDLHKKIEAMKAIKAGKDPNEKKEPPMKNSIFDSLFKKKPKIAGKLKEKPVNKPHGCDKLHTPRCKDKVIEPKVCHESPLRCHMIEKAKIAAGSTHERSLEDTVKNIRKKGGKKLSSMGQHLI